MANEFGDKTRRGAVIQRVGVVPLVQLPLVHDADGVANGKGLELVVGHEQRGGLGRLENGADLVRQALAQVHIQIGKRLIEQQQARLGRERTRQGDALLLAAREFVRKALVLAGQPHEFEHLGHARGARGARQVVDAKADVAPHVQMRKQGVVLKHHANLTIFGGQIEAGAAHHLAGEFDAARRCGLQPGHGPQQRGFAAARGANQHADVARAQTQRHVAHGRLAVARISHAQL